MKYQVNAPGWAVGQYLIPPTTVIDFASNDLYSTIARNHAVPLNISPLDDEAARALAAQQRRVGYTTKKEN
jgi:hypothetical protein